jgi:hypothetical protein
MKKVMACLLLVLCLLLLTCCKNGNDNNSTESYLQKGSIINNPKIPFYYFNDFVELYEKNNDSDKIKEYGKNIKNVEDNSFFAIRDYNTGVEIVQAGFEEEEIRIPEKLDGKPVIKLGGYFKDPEPIGNEEMYYSYYNCFDSEECEMIYLPSTVKEIVKGTFDIDSLKRIEVSKDNPYYSSKDGILYDKSGKIKLCVPRNHHSKHRKK